jgi:hypothetical protein
MQATPVQPQVNHTNSLIIHILIIVSRPIFQVKKDQLPPRPPCQCCLPVIAPSLFLAFYLMRFGQLLGLHRPQIFQHLLLITLRQLFMMQLMLQLILVFGLKAPLCLVSSGLLKTLSTSALLQVTALSFLLVIATSSCEFPL